MGLHTIIEPAGTLMTGWELVPEHDRKLTDVRNKDHARAPDPAEGDRSPPVEPQSKWERARSDGELGEV
ncbi:MAG TPA: hypothetical protein VI199_13560, partial [Novosphingobium sp.]